MHTPRRQPAHLESIHASTQARRFGESGRSPLTVERRQVGHRCVIMVDGALDAIGFRDACDAFLDAIEAGAHQVWIVLPPGDPLPTQAVDALVRLTTLAYELGRSAVLIVAVGPRHEALRDEPNLEVHESLAAAQQACR